VPKAAQFYTSATSSTFHRFEAAGVVRRYETHVADDTASFTQLRRAWFQRICDVLNTSKFADELSIR
jgi:hypothetical protein